MSDELPQNPDRPPDFCEYGVGVIGERLDKMLAHTEGAASGNDTRAIHQMRVWSRRSRAALDVFLPCFGGKASKEFADLEREVKTVTRALGAARDLDVMLETLQARAERLPADQQGGVESFLAHLRAQRADRQQAVTDSIGHLEKRRLKHSLHELAQRQGYAATTVEMPPAAAPATPARATLQEAGPPPIISIGAVDKSDAAAEPTRAAADRIGTEETAASGKAETPSPSDAAPRAVKPRAARRAAQEKPNG